MAILLSHKIGMKIRDKEVHLIKIKEKRHQKDIIIINLYKPNNRDQNYMKQKLTGLKKEIDIPTIDSWRLNTSL